LRDKVKVGGFIIEVVSAQSLNVDENARHPYCPIIPKDLEGEIEQLKELITQMQMYHYVYRNDNTESRFKKMGDIQIKIGQLRKSLKLGVNEEDVSE